MPQIRFEKVAFGYIDILFSNVTLTIGDNDRIGIVGNNGCGKSTFIKCIAGLIDPLEGRVFFPKGLKFGFIEQDIPKQLMDKNLYNVISDAIPEEERDHSIWKIENTLDVFKAPLTIRQKTIKELSGGWQRLALIARMVLSHPDILLLDEPTNHLDVAKILVLEQWLNEQVYNIPLIAISHDRTFLSNCTNKTFFLRGTEIREYNYSYSRAKQLLLEDDHALSARRAKELKELNRLKRSAHDLRQIGVNNYSDAALKKSIQMAKRAEGIETQLTNIHVEEKRSIKLSNSGIHTKRLIGMKNVDILTPEGAVIFHISHLDIMQGERLVIFGANGSGKSQFLKYIKNAMRDIDSARTLGMTITPSIKMGYIDQHLSHLPFNIFLHDYFNDEFSLVNQKITSILVNAGFPISIHRTKIGVLSHGQRARVAFLMLHLQQPNFYVMDEPTNHLDIDGQEQLESEILEQGAASIVVSHDRVFSENIGTKFYEIKDMKLLAIDHPDFFYKNILQSSNSKATL